MWDFNALWDGVGATYSYLAECLADCCWRNEINEKLTDNHNTLDTFIRGDPSQIDHILTAGQHLGGANNQKLTGFGCATGAVWQLFRDHVPLWASYKIQTGGLPPTQKEKGRVKKYAPETTPNVYKEEDVAEYEKRMLELLTSLPTDDLEGQAAAQLEKICRGSVHVARKIKPKRNTNKYSCNGWSPIYIALRAQLIALVNIRRGLCGFKHVTWAKEEKQRNVAALIHKWRAVVDKFTFECEEDKLRIMSWTGSSPSFWIENANQDTQMLMDKLGDEISHIHQAIGGRKELSSEGSSPTTADLERKTFEKERLALRLGQSVARS